MPIKIAKISDNIILATPISFAVTPLTVDEALTQGVLEHFEPENHFSPNRAGGFNILCDSYKRAFSFHLFVSIHKHLGLCLSIYSGSIFPTNKPWL